MRLEQKCLIEVSLGIRVRRVCPSRPCRSRRRSLARQAMRCPASSSHRDHSPQTLNSRHPSSYPPHSSGSSCRSASVNHPSPLTWFFVTSAARPHAPVVQRAPPACASNNAASLCVCRFTAPLMLPCLHICFFQHVLMSRCCTHVDPPRPFAEHCSCICPCLRDPLRRVSRVARAAFAYPFVGDTRN